jgi:hypothetical protein
LNHHEPVQSAPGGAGPADVRNTRIVGGRTVSVRFVELPHSQLRFYDDNPRVHSTLRSDGREPTQQQIEDHLVALDHVKKLAANIEKEGGLHDPVIVRGGQNDVLEGNCRLAAYRLLSRGRPGFERMRCEVLPADVDDDTVFSLLAQYHINGKLAWQPFEQAGFLFRAYAADDSKRSKASKIEAIAAKAGSMSARRAAHLIETFGFMLEHDDVCAEHWSHYDEYFTSREITRARKDHPTLDDCFVKIVPNIDAMDVRKKLVKVCSQEKPLKRFVAGAVGLDRALQQYRDSGADADAYQKFRRFRTWLAKEGVTEEILQYAGGERQKVLLEVRKLDLLVSRLRRAMEDGPPPGRRRTRA